MSDKTTLDYDRRVKVSNWFNATLSDPKDIEHPKRVSESHHRTFGFSDEVYIPKTTAQECLQSINEIKLCDREPAKKQMNYMTYPMDDSRFGILKLPPSIGASGPLSTTYRDVYTTRPIVQKKTECREKLLDPLFNRIPKNDFDMQPWSTHKFMDDHFVMLSEGRKKINRLRQIRNASIIFD